MLHILVILTTAAELVALLAVVFSDREYDASTRRVASSPRQRKAA
jgi:hypothetical protein